MHESAFSNGLVKHLRDNLGGSVVFKHSDQLSGGIPDISVTWGSKTLWLEVKVDRPGAIKDRSLQDTNMRRLAATGRNALYVVYGKLTTQIIHPVSHEIIYQSGIHKDHRLVEQMIRERNGPRA